MYTHEEFRESYFLILRQPPISGRSATSKNALSKLLHIYSPELGWLTNYAIANLGNADERRVVYFEKKWRLRNLVARHVYVHCKSSHLHRFEGYVKEAIVLLEPEEINE